VILIDEYLAFGSWAALGPTPCPTTRTGPSPVSGYSGSRRDFEVTGGNLDVTGKHGVEERVELLSYLPGEVALRTGGALLHRNSKDDRNPTGPLSHLRPEDRDPFTLVASLAPHHRRLRKSVDQHAGSGSYTVTTRSS